MADPQRPGISRHAFLTAGLGLAGVAGLAAASAPKAAAAPGDTGVEVFNVKEYGAIGDGTADDSAAVQKALDAIVAATRGVLYFPPGVYPIDQQIVAENVKHWDLTICGGGVGVSQLVCRNGDGIFRFTAKERARTWQTTIRDLSLFAHHQPHAGTAIDISETLGGNAHHRNLIIHDVEIRSYDNATDLFDVGVSAIGTWRPLLFNVIVAGPYPIKDNGDDSLLYKASCGVRFDGAFAPQMQNCYIWSVHTGVSNVRFETPTGEGTFFYNCFIVEVRVGLDIRMGAYDEATFPVGGGPEPGMAIDRCHVNARDIGIWASKSYFSVTNCLLYNSLKGFAPADAPPYHDIRLDHCISVVVSDTIFHQPTNDNRIGVYVTGRSTGIDIHDNTFNHKGIGVKVDEGCTDVVLSGNLINTGPDPRYPDIARIARPVVDETDGEVAVTWPTERTATVAATAAQAVAGSDWQTLAWSQEITDRGGLFDVAEPSAIVIPADAGIRHVRLHANVAWSAPDDGTRSVRVCRNGKPFPGGGSVSHSTALAAGLHVDDEPLVQNLTSAVIPVQSGDKLTLQVKQSGGTQVKVLGGADTWLSAEVVDG